MDPDAIDRVVRKYAGTEFGLLRDYSAHSMRATFITTALENGAQLEDVQKAAGHADPGTTKVYDRRGYNPERRRASSPHIEMTDTSAPGARITSPHY
jgi:integrase/recombinase XerD